MYSTCFSQENKQHKEQSSVAIALINSIGSSDEEGQSRQRMLKFAAKRYICISGNCIQSYSEHLVLHLLISYMNKHFNLDIWLNMV